MSQPTSSPPRALTQHLPLHTHTYTHVHAYTHTQDEDLKEAAALLNFVNEQCQASAEHEAREIDVTLDLEDADGQDAAGLSILCKSIYKRRWGQLSHPTKYLGVWRTSGTRARTHSRARAHTHTHTCCLRSGTLFRRAL